MKRRLAAGGVLALLITLVPAWAWASGEAATDLVVVADTRSLHGFNLYLATVYNQNKWLFAIWAVLITTGLGVCLGLLMDVIMSRIGLDLGKSAGHIEH